jgi:hypothetical protein
MYDKIDIEVVEVVLASLALAFVIIVIKKFIAWFVRSFR